MKIFEEMGLMNTSSPPRGGYLSFRVPNRMATRIYINRLLVCSCGGRYVCLADDLFAPLKRKVSDS